VQLPTRRDIHFHSQGSNSQCLKLAHDTLVLLLITCQNGDRSSGLSQGNGDSVPNAAVAAGDDSNALRSNRFVVGITFPPRFKCYEFQRLGC
jgi:hypothetical protein